MLIVILTSLLNLRGMREKFDMQHYSVSMKLRSLQFRMTIIYTLCFILWQIEIFFYRHRWPTMELAFLPQEILVYMLTRDYKSGFFCSLFFVIVFVISVCIISFPGILLFMAVDRKSLAGLILFVSLLISAELISGTDVKATVGRIFFVLIGGSGCFFCASESEWVNTIRIGYILYIVRMLFNNYN